MHGCRIQTQRSILCATSQPTTDTQGGQQFIRIATFAADVDACHLQAHAIFFTKLTTSSACSFRPRACIAHIASIDASSLLTRQPTRRQIASVWRFGGLGSGGDVISRTADEQLTVRPSICAEGPKLRKTRQAINISHHISIYYNS